MYIYKLLYKYYLFFKKGVERGFIYKACIFIITAVMRVVKFVYTLEVK